MTPEEVRLECLQLAVQAAAASPAGATHHHAIVETAAEFYEFVAHAKPVREGGR